MKPIPAGISRERESRKTRKKSWIPASAGMTNLPHENVYVSFGSGTLGLRPSMMAWGYSVTILWASSSPTIFAAA